MGLEGERNIILKEVSGNLFELAQAMGKVRFSMETAVNKMIESNEKLSKVNNRYAKAICLLTAGLVFVGLLPYIEKLFKYLFNLYFKG